MGFISEFKEFALKGNVMDLAVGVIIGAAFGKIVTSVVDDLIMPIVGIAGKVDFSNLYLPLSSDVQDAIEKANGHLSLAEAKKYGPVFAYGNFITVAIGFIIIAFIIFLMVKGMNSLKRKNADMPPPPAPPSKEEVLLAEIRDAIRAGKQPV